MSIITIYKEICTILITINNCVSTNMFLDEIGRDISEILNSQYFKT